jgi:hypothetical protein
LQAVWADEVRRARRPFGAPEGPPSASPTRGSHNSEGDIWFFGAQEGHDACDFIEWAAAQPWCTGTVAMAGNSWLAVPQ